jgi:hypothetical protein
VVTPGWGQRQSKKLSKDAAPEMYPRLDFRYKKGGGKKTEKIMKVRDGIGGEQEAAAAAKDR